MVNAMSRSLLKRHKFDPCLVKDNSEQVLLELQASRVTQLVSNPGRVALTHANLYFLPHNNFDKVFFLIFSYALKL